MSLANVTVTSFSPAVVKSGVDTVNWAAFKAKSLVFSVPSTVTLPLAVTARFAWVNVPSLTNTCSRLQVCLEESRT